LFSKKAPPAGGLESEVVKMKKRTKNLIKKNTKRFFKKFAYRFASRLLELLVLFGLGYAMGLKLVRY
jgi:hypothetical protein